MSRSEKPVAVIGGGPAGCSAAIALAEQGVRTVLFEARTYPHDKVCGEFLSPECAGLLTGLGMNDLLSTLRAAPIETVRLTAPGGASWQGSLPGRAYGISRRALDAALAERASARGVQVRQGSQVIGASGNLQDGFELEVRGASSRYRLTVRAVIAAHGKRGKLDRTLGREFIQQPQPFVALKSHLFGPPLPGRIELHAFPGGYCGLSEIEGGRRNLCLLAHASVFRTASANGAGRATDFIAWMQGQNRRLGEWLEEAEPAGGEWISIAQVPFVPKPALENDILMAGDAAGLIVPLAGDGIAMALEGGQMAASYLLHYLVGKLTVDGLRQDYPSAWHRRFGERLRLGRWLQSIMLRPAQLALALRLLSALPPLGRYLIARTRGKGVMTRVS